MNLERFYVIGATLVFFTTALSLALTLFTWRNRRRPDVRYFLGFLVATTIWQLAACLVFLSPNPETADFWVRTVKFAAVSFTPVAFLALTLDYTGRTRWLHRRNLALLSLIPAVTALLSCIRSPFFITGRVFERFGPYLIETSQELQFWFWVHITYSYGLVVIAFVLLAGFAFRARGPYRPQAAIMMAGAVLVMVVNVLTVFNVLDPEPPELTALTFGGLTFLWAWALYRFGLLDLMPVARHAVVESMADAVIVLDPQDRIVDLNRAARKLIPAHISEPIGKSTSQIWPHRRDLIESFESVAEIKTELAFGEGPDWIVFDINISTFYRREEEAAGRLVVLRNITERARIEKRLKEINLRLEEQLARNQTLQEAFKQQAIRDPLTGLYNRGYLEHLLEEAHDHLVNTGEPIGLVMIDIDRFKRVNDTFGHHAGDRVLKSLGEMLQGETRQRDSVCRYGGDEFIVILPGMDRAAALERAERWRSHFEQLRLEIDGAPIPATLSIGVAVISDESLTTDEMFRILDDALYRSKVGGRNQVTVLE